jgi:aminoglycoside phosphotransferase (APT) family kinase protein
MVLEPRFGKLTQIGGGYHSVVYANDLDQIVKVYKHNTGMHRLEAQNMARAGLGEWVIETPTVAGQEALVMRRFEGKPVSAETLPAALGAIGVFLRQLHEQRFGQVNTAHIQHKLEKFEQRLQGYPDLQPLLNLVRHSLETGVLATRSAFCHLDLWFENILFAPPDQVRIVDWHKAGEDDPARDYALLFTGTLELLPIQTATQAILELARFEDGIFERLPTYVALTTLHDLYWFLEKQPEHFQAAYKLKLPRIMWFLETTATSHLPTDIC